MAIMRYVSLEKQRPDLTKIPHNCPKEVNLFDIEKSLKNFLVDRLDDKMLGS